ncbi:MAG: hypothetical protein OWQ48_03100 [Desulfurococcus sp.]|nr:hypothetical protein [Desulfurococcus sp.]
MDSGYDEHAAAQDYVVSLLRYYGFDARKEVWISGGRIDIAGRCVNRDLCKSYSVAIEVSRTSDLAKDLDRLSKASYDLKFVVLLKPYGELPSIFGNIWITRETRTLA